MIDATEVLEARARGNAADPAPSAVTSSAVKAGNAVRSSSSRWVSTISRRAARGANGHVALTFPAASPADVAAAVRGSLADPLSERELRGPAPFDVDLTGPEIAGQLFVSLNTLRAHTERIFTKLDVSTRFAAVRRGHELGLP